jgi:hypothetical protein
MGLYEYTFVVKSKVTKFYLGPSPRAQRNNVNLHYNGLMGVGGGGPVVL